MAESTLGISFSKETLGIRSCFKIEQKPWGADVGKTTTLQAIVGISAAIYGNEWPNMRCGGLNGIFEADVYVYPCDSSTPFQFRVSHGTVRSSTVEIAYREEIVQSSLQLQATPEYPVQSMGTVAWIGNCYDASGNVTTRPTVTLENNVLTFSKKVFGSVRVRYTVFRYIYSVEVSKRLLALENKYQSVAYVVWDGGVKWCDVEAPADFEQFDGLCGNGGDYDDGEGEGDGEDGDGDGDDGLPTANGADRKIVIDYCSQEQISDTLN